MQNSGNEITSWVAAAVTVGVLIFMIRWATPDQSEFTTEDQPTAGDVVAEVVPATPVPAKPPEGTSKEVEITAAPVAAKKPVPKPKPAATTAPVPPVAAVKAEKPTAEPKAPSDSSVTSAVSQWAKCWAEQDVSCYISAYSTGFVPENGVSLQTWKELRSKKVSAPKSIALNLSPLQLIESTDRQVTVQFEHQYRSPTYADKSLKTLILSKESGGWKILRETSVDLQ